MFCVQEDLPNKINKIIKKNNLLHKNIKMII